MQVFFLYKWVYIKYFDPDFHLFYHIFVSTYQISIAFEIDVFHGGDIFG